MVHTASSWKASQLQAHPVIHGLVVEVYEPGYGQVDRPAPAHPRKRNMNGLADTGAQMTVLGPRQMDHLRVKKEVLMATDLKIITADGKEMII
jgi:hypothetical protein